jgi:hypothetical protein
VVIVAWPELCAVKRPDPLTLNANGLSEAHPAHVGVTFCVVPFENVPVAVICAVAPACRSELNAAAKLTDCSVGVVGVVGGVLVGGVGAAGLLLLPHAARRKQKTMGKLNRRIIYARSPVIAWIFTQDTSVS